MPGQVSCHAKKAVGLLCALLVAIAAVCANPRAAMAAEEWVITEDSTVYYIKADDTFANTEWLYLDGAWCWFGEDGALEYLWFSISDSWYFYFANGTPCAGWVFYADNWYYFTETGRLCINEWVSVDDEWYYFDAYARMAHDCWVNTAGYWSHLDEYGHPITGWGIYNGYYYYLNEFGFLVVDGWAPYGNVWYRMNSYGTISTSVYPVEAVSRTVQTPQGTVRGYQLVPQGVRSAPLVIYSHGLGGSGLNFLANGLELGGLGISSYLFDFVGGSPTSASGGSFQEMSIDTEGEQLEAIISAAKTWSGVNTRRICLMGHSQGGLISTRVAAGRTDIAGIILFAPGLNMPELLRYQYESLNNVGATFTFFGKTLGRRYAIDMWDVTEHDVISAYTGDSLVFHGTADEVIDPYVSARAKLAWGDRCTLVWLSGLGHNAVVVQNATIVSRIYNFVQTHETSSSPWWPWGDWSWPWGAN